MRNRIARTFGSRTAARKARVDRRSPPSRREPASGLGRAAAARRSARCRRSARSARPCGAAARRRRDSVDEADELGVRAGALVRRGDRLVAIAEPIDELRLERLVGEQRRRDRSARAPRRGGSLRPAAMPSTICPEIEASSVLDLLALRRRSSWFRSERSAAVLYSSRWSNSGAMPSRSSVPLKKRRLGTQPDQADAAHRLQPDLVERGGQIIGAGAGAELAEAVGIGDRELALGAEGGDRVAQLCASASPISSSPTRARRPLTRGSSPARLDRVENVAQRRLGAEDQLPTALLAGARRRSPGQIEPTGRCCRGATACPAADRNDRDPRTTTTNRTSENPDRREKADDEAAHRSVVVSRTARGGAADGRRARSAIIASPTGTARMPTQGSWRPLVLISTSLPCDIDGAHRRQDRAGRLDRKAHDDVLPGRDAAEDAAGVVRQKDDLAVAPSASRRRSPRRSARRRRSRRRSRRP